MIKLSFFVLLALLSIHSRADFAFGSKVETTKEFSRIENLLEGQEIKTLSTEAIKENLRFQDSLLFYSSGTSPAVVNQNLIRVDYYVKDIAHYLIVTPDQPFISSKGLWILARDLVLDRDELMDAEGQAARIFAIHKGPFATGLHHIATGSRSSLQNVFVVNSVLVGSLRHQVYFQVKKLSQANAFKEFFF